VNFDVGGSDDAEEKWDDHCDAREKIAGISDQNFVGNPG
jgi:hypothetical protein